MRLALRLKKGDIQTLEVAIIQENSLTKTGMILITDKELTTILYNGRQVH